MVTDLPRQATIEVFLTVDVEVFDLLVTTFHASSDIRGLSKNHEIWPRFKENSGFFKD